VAMKEIIISSHDQLECVDKFCYYEDLIDAGGGAEEASRASTVRCAWAKFRELAPVLTSKGASLKGQGKVYRACIQSVLGYASEPWAMKVEDMARLERTERIIVR